MQTNLDKLCDKVTASRTWADLKAKLDRGYVPTLKLRTKAAKELDMAIRARGYRTWNG